MESFRGKIAVVTGGGTGMGRELVVQLAAEGCSVATCDVNADTMAATRERALAGAASSDVRVTTHVADVSDEDQVVVFRDEALAAHDTDHVHALFNNAGIGGGGSFVAGDRAAWERTFGVCWGGVYACSRVFLPLVVAAPEGVVVNTSSVNGFFASIGPGIPHTAYSAAKFAVRGFTEALREDLRVNAPHVTAHVVMPGHVGTDIVLNSRAILGEDIARARSDLAKRGVPVEGMSDDDLRAVFTMMGEGFRDTAPTSAARAATVILDAVKAGEWRILVGEDAEQLDELVRADPVGVYDPDRPAFQLLRQE